MGTSEAGEPSLIRLSLIDFFTGDVLLDSLVIPSHPMRHYNTRYSGVSATDMRNADRSGRCIRGRDAARELVWQHVGPDTVLVVHGGAGDLAVLRWIHGVVVDSFLVDRFDGTGEVEGGRSLKNLAWWRVGRVVQEGNGGHDSLEDARACRELVHALVGQIPG